MCSDSELERVREAAVKAGGGNFYLTVGARVSKRFARAIIVSTFEGQSSYTDAFYLLGVRGTASLRKLGHRLGVLM